MSMKFKKITAVIMAALLISSFASCANASGNKSSVSSSVAILDTSDMFSNKDKEIGYDESDCISITLSGSSASSDDKNVSISGSTVTISKEGTYLLSGTLDNGQIIVDADDSAKVRLIFNGVNINCDTSAAVYVKQADKVFITLAKGTQNTLSNSKEFVAIDDNNIDAVLFSKEDLTINGSGSLTVNAKYGHGIVSKDDLVIASGTYTITSEKKGLAANDSIRIADGEFTITSGTDALHAENTDDASKGYIYIAGGTFHLTAGTDGIDASGAVQIDDGTFTITTGSGSSNASTKQDGSKNADWGNWGGGRMGRGGNMGGMNGSVGIDDSNARQMSADNSEALSVVTLAAVSGASAATTTSDSSSAKGIKSESSVAINNGTFKIDSSDDSIHSNNAVSISNGTFEIASGDDGVHADAALTISGGTVNITKSYEGLEGQTIGITGGNISVVASDDGLNAAGGNDQSSMNGRMGQNEFAAQDGVEINISGGTLNVTASGDGIDSNGNITVSGGEIYVSGPSDNGNAAFDYNGSATITGGIVIATGMSGMAQNFGSNSTQGSMLVTVSNQSAGSTVTLKDSSGKTIATFTPANAYNSVLVSTPDVKKGSTYTLVAGSTETSVTMDSLIYGSGTGMGGGMGGRGGDMNGDMDGNGGMGNMPDGNMGGNGGMNGGKGQGRSRR